MGKPYNEEKDEFGVIKRTFYETTDSDEFVWHRDKKDRLVTPINETDWSIQFDNELPKKMVVGETIEIPKESFHRVIKGSGDLIVEVEEFSSIDEAKKKKTKKDACYHKVKSRYKVWPSAYASGALVKCRKVGAKNWGNKTKEGLEENKQEFQDKALDKINRLGGFDNLPDIDKLALLGGTNDDGLKSLSLRNIYKENGGTLGHLTIKVRVKGVNQQPIDHKFSKEFAGKEGYLFAGIFYSNDNKPYVKVRFDEFVPNSDYKGGGSYEERPIMLDNIYPIDYDEIKSDFIKYQSDVDQDRKDFLNRFGLDDVDEGFDVNEADLEVYEANSYDSWKERGNQLEKQAKVDVINAFDNAAKGKDFEEMVDMFVSDRDINGGEYLDAFRIVLKKYNLEDEFRKQLANLDIMNEAKKNRKLTAKPSSEKNLGDWFARKGGKGKSKGWVDCNTCRKDKKTGRNKCKPCGRKEGEKRAKYPACRPTPSACKTKGKGKSWGKKSKKKSVNENVDKSTINRFLSDFGMLTTLNLAKVQSYAKTDEAKNKLAEMQRTLNTFTSKYFDVIDPTKNTELYKPETLSKIIGKIGEYINYIKPYIEQFVKDSDTKDAWLNKIQGLSDEYLKIIGKTNENRVYLIKNMLNENSEVLDVVEVFSIYNSEDSHTLEPEVKPIEKPTTVPVKRPDSPYTPKRRTKSKPKANR